MNYLNIPCSLFSTTEGHLYPTVLHTVLGRLMGNTPRKATATAEQVGACNGCVRNSPGGDTSSICKKRFFLFSLC